MNKDEFIKILRELNIEVTAEKLDLLNVYYRELIEYNSHTNLTAITKEEDVYLKHFYDSLTITKAVDLNTIDNLLDIGSGAGFPGLVLKIFYPHLKITLLDSNNKKTTFLSCITEKLNLENVTIIHDRVENYAKENLNKFDIVTSRAVANLRVITELSLPLVKVNGYFIAMKGNIDEELKDAEKTISSLSSKIEKIIDFNLYQETGQRNIIKIKKLKETTIKELRPYDKIIKRSL